MKAAETKATISEVKVDFTKLSVLMTWSGYEPEDTIVVYGILQMINTMTTKEIQEVIDKNPSPVEKEEEEEEDDL